MARDAILIGTVETCELLERQLALLPEPPVVVGSVHLDRDDRGPAALEALLARRRPSTALLAVPRAHRAATTGLVARLRGAGVSVRIVPPLDELVAGGAAADRAIEPIDLLRLVGRAPRRLDHAAIARVVTGRRVLVTGAGGSIGAELARLVAAFDPARLVLVERAEPALFEIDRQLARAFPAVERRARLHDVVDARETRRLFGEERPDLVLHAAAHKHVPMMEDHPGAAIDNNLFGTRAALEAARASGASRFVMVSTDKAVRPTSVMGASKRLAELAVQADAGRDDMARAVVRFGNVLGSSGSVLEVWSRQVAEGDPISVTDERMTRYFMSIPEAAALVLQAAAMVDADDAPESRRADARARDGAIFVLDMGEPIRIVDLAARFLDLHGTPVVRADGATGAVRPTLAVTGIRPGEKLHEVLAMEPGDLLPSAHEDIRRLACAPPDPGVVRAACARLEPTVRPESPASLAGLLHELVGALDAAAVGDAGPGVETLLDGALPGPPASGRTRDAEHAA